MMCISSYSEGLDNVGYNEYRNNEMSRLWEWNGESKIWMCKMIVKDRKV